MTEFKKLDASDLLALKDAFKVNWPLHIATYSTIDIFARRFVEHPEWTDRVTFFGVQGEPEHFKTLIMIHSGDKVFFDTLEPFPYDKLRRALLVIELGQKITFIDVRDCFRPLLLDVIWIRRLEICHENRSRNYIFPYKPSNSSQLNLELPDGFRFGPLRLSDAKLINDTWAGKFENSLGFVEDAIRLNTSMGIYNAEDELIAWNVRLDDGAMGIGRVDPRYEGNHLGYMAIISLAQKIVQDFNVDAFFHVLRGNSKADKDLAASNAELIDTFSWISVKQNKEPYKMPWWGHL